MDCKEWLVKWLNDAYAVDEAMVNTLQHHVDQLVAFLRTVDSANWPRAGPDPALASGAARL
jgi:hypothetical protein